MILARISIGAFLASVLAVVVWSCAGSLDNVDEYRNSIGSVTISCFDNTEPPAFLTESGCVQCHLSRTNGKGAALDLLSPDIAGRFSVLEGSCPQALLIDSANPRASTLYTYVADLVDGCTYHAMPPTGQLVSDSDKQCLLTWIDGLDGNDDLGLNTSDGADDGDDDPMTGGDSGGDDDGDDGPMPTGVTLAQLQSEIFNPKCAACHSSTSPSRGLVLAGINEATLRTNIVNKPSDESNLDLIEPNNRDGSYIYRKLANNLSDVAGLGCTSSCGAQMPRNGPYLTPAELKRVEDWINAGAP
jgi:hypothetical protein